jgi:hypothetical protein
MFISGPTLLYGQWLSTISCVRSGAITIVSYYATSSKLPFALPAISNYQDLVFSTEDFKELSQAPDKMMSFYKAINERLFSQHTMGGFVPDNGVDEKNSTPNRVFKTLARENLSGMDAPSTEGVRDVFQGFFDGGKVGVGGGKRMKLQESNGTLIARMNNTLLFRYDLGKSEYDLVEFGYDLREFEWQLKIGVLLTRGVARIQRLKFIQSSMDGIVVLRWRLFAKSPSGLFRKFSFSRPVTIDRLTGSPWWPKSSWHEVARCTRSRLLCRIWSINDFEKVQ